MVGRQGPGSESRGDHERHGTPAGGRRAERTIRSGSMAGGGKDGSGRPRQGPPPGEGVRRREGRREEREPRGTDPALGDEVRPEMLDREARGRLRTLAKENAEVVARHLVAAGLQMDLDPEIAYAHAHAALRRAARVDVVREAVGLTAYATGRYGEALRELRAARRLSGQDAHRAVEADCERGLGRPERALALAVAPEAAALPETERVELAIVASGARLDMGDPGAALVALDAPVVRAVRDADLRARVAQARAAVLEALGRPDEARALLVATGATSGDTEDEVVVVDLGEEDRE